jgi:D-alanine-D-alanine ligase
VTNVKIAFTHNVRRSDAIAEAEFDSPATIEAIAGALERLGHEVERVDVARPVGELIALLEEVDPELVFNLAEGSVGRFREAVYPMLFEQLGLAYTGSDASTMTLTLDKALAKRLVSTADVATPCFQVLKTGLEPLDESMQFPMIIKPVAEGTSKGITAQSVCHNEAELRERSQKLTQLYPAGVLVEEFLSGREFTVGLLENEASLGEGGEPRVLPIMEIVFTGDAEHPVYGFEHKTDADKSVRFDVPADIDSELERQLAQAAKKSFDVLGCRDFGRIDFRLDADGVPNFIECNPLPGLSPGWSDFSVIGQAAGLDYHELIGEIIAPAIRRAYIRNEQLEKTELPTNKLTRDRVLRAQLRDAHNNPDNQS